MDFEEVGPDERPRKGTRRDQDEWFGGSVSDSLGQQGLPRPWWTPQEDTFGEEPALLRHFGIRLEKVDLLLHFLFSGVLPPHVVESFLDRTRIDELDKSDLDHRVEHGEQLQHRHADDKYDLNDHRQRFDDQLRTEKDTLDGGAATVGHPVDDCA